MAIWGVADVDLWWCSPEQLMGHPYLEACELWMTPDERARSANFGFGPARHLFRVGRALLRTTVCRYTQARPAEVRFGKGAWGQPLLAAPMGTKPFYFSLTHTPTLVACAISQTVPVGLDALGHDSVQQPQSVANLYFAPAEAQLLRTQQGSARVRTFERLWSLKEAYAKARGLGLHLPLRATCFAVGHQGHVRVHFAEANERSHDWQFQVFDDLAKHTLAIAVKSRTRPRIAMHHVNLLHALKASAHASYPRAGSSQP